MAAGDARAERGKVIERRIAAAGVGDDLSESKQSGEGQGELQAELAVKSEPEGECADGAEEGLPGESIRRQAAGGAIEFDGYGDAGGEAGGESEEKSEAEAVSDAEDDGISDGAGEQAERAVLASEKVVGEIEAAENIEASTADGDGGDSVVVHADDCMRYACFWEFGRMGGSEVNHRGHEGSRRKFCKVKIGLLRAGSRFSVLSKITET